MKQFISDKRIEYSLYLNKQLSKNADRIQVEKTAIDKLQTGFKSMSEAFKSELESQLDIISKED